MLQAFAKAWIGFSLVVNVISIISVWTFDGWWKVTEIWNPFNPFNLIAEMILLSPAIGALLWLERRGQPLVKAPN